jgi:hypothetical protein
MNLKSYFTLTNFLSPYRYGFSDRQSTVTNINSFSYYISEQQCKQLQVILFTSILGTHLIKLTTARNLTTLPLATIYYIFLLNSTVLCLSTIQDPF